MLQINGSLAKHNERIWCTFRTRNLYQYDAISYLTELNGDFDQISERRLIAENGNTAFEDVRLFSAGQTLLAFYTYFPKNQDGGWDWIYGVGMGKVDVESGIIKNQVSLRALSRRLHEKNWVPYIFMNTLFVITDFDPILRIIKVGEVDGAIALEEVFASEAKALAWSYGEVRGGTPLLENPGDGLLYGFVHSYLLNDRGYKRYYYYTAVRFNPVDNTVEMHPEPLAYEDEKPDDEYNVLWDISNGKTLKVIFPIGITHHNNGILVSFGKDDVCSCTMLFEWEKITDLFLNYGI